MASREYVEAQMTRARECLEVIPDLVEKGHYAFAIERAYYACFYAASALLSTRGLGFSKHAALIGAFGKEFAKPKLIDPVHHETLAKLFKVRQDVTYAFDVAPSAELAGESASRAVEFVDAIEAFLKRPS
jgi:uncharacterized protein (UPF0332 family)